MSDFQEYPKAVGPNRDRLARDADHEAQILAALVPAPTVPEPDIPAETPRRGRRKE